MSSAISDAIPDQPSIDRKSQKGNLPAIALHGYTSKLIHSFREFFLSFSRICS